MHENFHSFGEVFWKFSLRPKGIIAGGGRNMHLLNGSSNRMAIGIGFPYEPLRGRSRWSGIKKLTYETRTSGSEISLLTCPRLRKNLGITPFRRNAFF